MVILHLIFPVLMIMPLVIVIMISMLVLHKIWVLEKVAEATYDAVFLGGYEVRCVLRKILDFRVISVVLHGRIVWSGCGICVGWHYEGSVQICGFKKSN